MDAFEGYAEARKERYQGIRIALAENRDIQPPLGPELMAELASEISKRAQEKSILGLRQVNRIRTQANLKARLTN